MNFQNLALQLLKEGKVNILLSSQGGAGKTTALLELYRQLLNGCIDNTGKKMIPIYVPGADCDASENGIRKYIWENYFGTADIDEVTDAITQYEKLLFNTANTLKCRFILLVDGTNEKISEQLFETEIGKLSSRNNVSVIIASRTKALKFDNFIPCKLKELSKETIQKTIGEVPDNLFGTLTTPFYLAMYNKIKDEKIENNESGNELISRYIDWSCKKITEKNSAKEYKNKCIEQFAKEAVDYIFPYLCSKLYELGNMCFSINDNILMDEAKKDIPKYCYTDVEDIQYACETILVPMGILSKLNDTEYNISHEIYRDYFYAKYVVHNIQYDSNQTILLLRNNLSKDVLSFIKDGLIKIPESIRRIENINNAIQKEKVYRSDSIINRNIILLFGLLTTNLEGLNFSNRDLSKSIFSNFLKTTNCDFSNSQISWKTFPFNVGMKTGGTNYYYYLDEKIVCVSAEGNLYILNKDFGELEKTIFKVEDDILHLNPETCFVDKDSFWHIKENALYRLDLKNKNTTSIILPLYEAPDRTTNYDRICDNGSNIICYKNLNDYYWPGQVDEEEYPAFRLPKEFQKSILIVDKAEKKIVKETGVEAWLASENYLCFLKQDGFYIIQQEKTFFLEYGIENLYNELKRIGFPQKNISLNCVILGIYELSDALYLVLFNGILSVRENKFIPIDLGDTSSEEYFISNSIKDQNKIVLFLTFKDGREKICFFEDKKCEVVFPVKLNNWLANLSAENKGIMPLNLLNDRTKELVFWWGKGTIAYKGKLYFFSRNALLSYDVKTEEVMCVQEEMNPFNCHRIFKSKEKIYFQNGRELYAISKNGKNKFIAETETYTQIEYVHIEGSQIYYVINNQNKIRLCKFSPDKMKARVLDSAIPKEVSKIVGIYGSDANLIVTNENSYFSVYRKDEKYKKIFEIKDLGNHSTLFSSNVSLYKPADHMNCRHIYCISDKEIIVVGYIRMMSGPIFCAIKINLDTQAQTVLYTNYGQGRVCACVWFSYFKQMGILCEDSKDSFKLCFLGEGKYEEHLVHKKEQDDYIVSAGLVQCTESAAKDVLLWTWNDETWYLDEGEVRRKNNPSLAKIGINETDVITSSITDIDEKNNNWRGEIYVVPLKVWVSNKSIMLEKKYEVSSYVFKNDGFACGKIGNKLLFKKIEEKTLVDEYRVLDLSSGEKTTIYPFSIDITGSNFTQVEPLNRRSINTIKQYGAIIKNDKGEKDNE